MRRTQILVGVVVAVLIAAAVGAYAWDASKKDQIAEGVRIGDVNVGGLSSDEAQKVVRKRLVKPLEKPVTVKYDGVRYVLDPDHLQMRADVDGMVDSAVDASRDASLPTRLWRDVSGDEVDATVSPHIVYSNKAVDEFVDKVADEIDRDPTNATIAPTADTLNAVPGAPGRSLQAAALRRQIAAAVQSPHGRTIEAQVDEVQPDVTTDELAQQYPTYITVDRGAFQLRLWKDLKLVHTYPIAVGQVGLETPAGLYHIENMAVNPAWSVPNSAWAGSLAGTVVPGGTPENPLKARWMGIFDGAGIHGTDDLASLGTAASHGCIRMAIPDVISLYDQVDVGTPTYIG
jgi:lipoprotein-anchoring transpeptidase ErfK/SrfK